MGTVDYVAQDQERGAFINVVVKPAANLQHLDEVLVVTSMEPHLSKQQLADLHTSEEQKGAEVAADLERKKAALEMEQRLPGVYPENPDGTEQKEEPKPMVKDANGNMVPAVPPDAEAAAGEAFRPVYAGWGGGAGVACGGGSGCRGWGRA